MPQIILLALASAGAWLGYRWFRNEAQKVKANLRAAEDELRLREARARDRRASEGELDRAAIPKLELDPETGVYRPKSSGNV